MLNGQILKFDFDDSEWIVTKIEESRSIEPKETWRVEVCLKKQKELQIIGEIRLFDDGYWVRSQLLGIHSVHRQTIRRCVGFLYSEWLEQKQNSQ